VRPQPSSRSNAEQRRAEHDAEDEQSELEATQAEEQGAIAPAAADSKAARSCATRQTDERRPAGWRRRSRRDLPLILSLALDCAEDPSPALAAAAAVLAVTADDGRTSAVKILGIDHVQVAVPRGSEAEARAFYGDLLGLEELPRPTTLPDRYGCWFRAGTQELHIGFDEPFHPARKAHPSFVVDDLAALVARLRALGTEATPDASIPGVERAFVYDPFGNRLELRQA
jgi:catechol 2,3-dioxygenase-like lactoylglutathione lyase family enzyme